MLKIRNPLTPIGYYVTSEQPKLSPPSMATTERAGLIDYKLRLNYVVIAFWRSFTQPQTCGHWTAFEVRLNGFKLSSHAGRHLHVVYTDFNIRRVPFSFFPQELVACQWQTSSSVFVKKISLFVYNISMLYEKNNYNVLEVLFILSLVFYSNGNMQLPWLWNWGTSENKYFSYAIICFLVRLNILHASRFFIGLWFA